MKTLLVYSISLFIGLSLCIGMTTTGCTDNQALNDIRNQLQEEKEKNAAEKKEKEKNERFKADMLRFERLKRDARNGDVNALEEMKRLADTIGE